MPAPTVTDSLTPLIDSLRALRATWPTRGWSWDSRLACVASSFSTELQATAHDAATRVLSSEWNAASIAQAPPHVRDIAQRAGGLRSGQLVLVGAPAGRFFAYGLWWPWGDGFTISLRVGLGGADFREEILARVRDAFGVEL